MTEILSNVVLICTAITSIFAVAALLYKNLRREKRILARQREILDLVKTRYEIEAILNSEKLSRELYEEIALDPEFYKKYSEDHSLYNGEIDNFINSFLAYSPGVLIFLASSLIFIFSSRSPVDLIPNFLFLVIFFSISFFARTTFLKNKKREELWSLLSGIVSALLALLIVIVLFS